MYENLQVINVYKKKKKTCSVQLLLKICTCMTTNSDINSEIAFELGHTFLRGTTTFKANVFFYS